MQPSALHRILTSTPSVVSPDLTLEKQRSSSIAGSNIDDIDSTSKVNENDYLASDSSNSDDGESERESPIKKQISNSTDPRDQAQTGHSNGSAQFSEERKDDGQEEFGEGEEEDDEFEQEDGEVIEKSPKG